MEKDYLVPKRASASRTSGEWREDDFDVLADARSVCLLAYSRFRFPSSTYFMATFASCRSFARRPCNYMPYGDRHPSRAHYRYPRHHTMTKPVFAAMH
jgi:hypothetical protein